MTDVAITPAVPRGLLGLFKTAMTEDEANTVFCPMRLLLLVVVVVFCFLACWAVIVQRTPFNAVPFATAGAILLGGGSAAIVAKHLAGV